ncbi:ABC transporter ATP-binding protein [Candidatus Fermentibacteria bacterium]|nr:ABC transporter ATP-binding protein [Candidatus Fermentibacteria bacterium]
MDSIVSIRGLKKYFPVKSEALFGKTTWNKAIDGIDLEIQRGEALGVVGESGSGKTTLGKLILGLHAPTEGTIDYRGHDTGRMQSSVVFQDPFSSLNPRQTVFDIVKEPLESVRGTRRGQGFRQTILDILNLVGLSEEQMFRYPHEFSGGQRQRIAIARAIVAKPLFIVFDEPTSGLDVSVQAQILNLLKELKGNSDLSYVFISHNIGVVKYICSRIAVMYRGKIVETSGNQELFDNPLHPYSQHLLSAVPVIDETRMSKIIEFEAKAADEAAVSNGCIYYSKCPIRRDICREKPPQRFDATEGHSVYCWARELDQR